MNSFYATSGLAAVLLGSPLTDQTVEVAIAATILVGIALAAKRARTFLVSRYGHDAYGAYREARRIACGRVAT